MRPAGEHDDSSLLAAISGPVTSCALRLRKQPRTHEPLMPLFHKTAHITSLHPCAPHPPAILANHETSRRPCVSRLHSCRFRARGFSKLGTPSVGKAPCFATRLGSTIRDGLHASLHPAPVRPSCAHPRRQPRKNHACLLFVEPPRDRGLTPCARCDPLPEKMPLTDLCNQHSSRAPYEQLDSLAPPPARKPCSLARTKPPNEPRARVRLRLTALPQLQPRHDQRSPLLG